MVVQNFEVMCDKFNIAGICKGKGKGKVVPVL
jgi:hypothetical protein